MARLRPAPGLAIVIGLSTEQWPCQFGGSPPAPIPVANRIGMPRLESYPQPGKPAYRRDLHRELQHQIREAIKEGGNGRPRQGRVHLSRTHHRPRAPGLGADAKGGGMSGHTNFCRGCEPPTRIKRTSIVLSEVFWPVSRERNLAYRHWPSLFRKSSVTCR
jgi:hypothetical protein